MSDRGPSEQVEKDPWHTCFDPFAPGPKDPTCPGCMKEANGNWAYGSVRECGNWHPEGAVEHNAANCWLEDDDADADD